MAEGGKTGVVIAVIGLVGVLGASVIGNWDKITGPSQAS